MHMLPINDVTI